MQSHHSPVPDSRGRSVLPCSPPRFPTGCRMVWRKWLVRGLVFSVVVGLAAIGLFYQQWTNPVAVRSEVLEKLHKHFTGARVAVESAHLRLLGGIAVSELRMSSPRRSRTERLSLRSLRRDLPRQGTASRRQARHPQDRTLPPAVYACVRGAEGSWNLSGILGPVDLNESIPTIVIQQGTILVEDRQADGSTPPVEIKDVNLTLINDPRPMLGFEGTGASEVVGNVKVRGTWQREHRRDPVSVGVAQYPGGPTLVQHLATYWPDMAAQTRELQGIGKLQASLSYHPESAQSLEHDVRFELAKGRLVARSSPVSAGEPGGKGPGRQRPGHHGPRQRPGNGPPD